MTINELFDAFEEAWSGRDTEAFVGLVTSEVHYEDPFTPEPLTGVRALANHARRFWRAFPDGRVNRTGDRLAGGPFVAAPFRILGTHTEPLGHLPATGRAIVVHGVAYAELQDERLHRIRAFFDVYGAGVQIGALPKPGTVGERALLALRGFGLRSPSGR